MECTHVPRVLRLAQLAPAKKAPSRCTRPETKKILAPGPVNPFAVPSSPLLPLLHFLSFLHIDAESLPGFRKASMARAGKLSRRTIGLRAKAERRGIDCTPDQRTCSNKTSGPDASGRSGVVVLSLLASSNIEPGFSASSFVLMIVVLMIVRGVRWRSYAFGILEGICRLSRGRPVGFWCPICLWSKVQDVQPICAARSIYFLAHFVVERFSSSMGPVVCFCPPPEYRPRACQSFPSY